MSADRFTIAPHVEYTEVEGDYVLMDLRSGVYLGLDPVASQIWQSLSDHGDLGRAADELCQRFRVDRERALNDTEAWVGELVERGLLTKRPESER